MKRIFIFSGLGADHRAFQFLDLSNYEPVYISWLTPLTKESISDYARRILPQITSTKPIIIGLSFGGIVAIEVSKLLEVEKIILIASSKTAKEIPYYYRVAGRLNFHKLISARVLKSPSRLTYWFFSAKSNEDKKLLAEILRDTEIEFLKWAIHQIVKWDNRQHFSNLTHIHGTADRILPISFVKVDIPVVKGGHFMTINKSKEISQILKSLL